MRNQLKYSMRKEEDLEKTINALKNLIDANQIGEEEKQSALKESEGS